jgi:hypothetical protein
MRFATRNPFFNSRVYDERVHHYYIILNKMEIVIYITIFLYTIKYIYYLYSI